MKLWQKQSKFKMSKKILKYSIFAAVLLFIVYLSMNVFSYFDPFSFCYVRIESDVLRGNRQTVKEVINMFKKDDRNGYGDFCRYVDRIKEGFCFTSSRPANNEISQGCYVKGSKTIYLKPLENEGAVAVSERYNAIKKYSSFSKTFWESLRK